MIDNQYLAVHTFLVGMSTLLSVDEILLPRYMNLYNSVRGLSVHMEVASSYLKHINFALSEFK